MQKVGFVGIGNMGWGMSANIARADFDLVVYDTDPSRTERFSHEHGVRFVTALEALSDREVIVTMLPTGKVVSDVLLGGASGGGLASMLQKGAIVVDMSSSEPTGTRVLARKLAELGIVLIDAPVSGGVARANAGTLAIMAGTDDPNALTAVTPLLSTMGEKVFATGGVGCGHAMKALNNYASTAAFAAAVEALLIGERFGLDQGTMVEIMNASTGRSFHTDVVIKPQIVERKFNAGFAVGLLAKDMRIAAELSKAVERQSPILDIVNERCAFASDSLGATRDFTESILAWKGSD